MSFEKINADPDIDEEGIWEKEEMINIIALFFTKELLNSYEPVHLLLGLGIGIVGIAILIKKIINRRNRKWIFWENY